MGILGRMAASPLSANAIAQPVPNGASQANDGVGSSYGQPTREESVNSPQGAGCPQGRRSQLEACSDMTGASYRNLLKWKDLPIAEAYVRR